MLHREAILLELRRLLSAPKDTEARKASGRAERIRRKAGLLGLGNDAEINQLTCDYIYMVGERFEVWDEKLYRQTDQSLAKFFKGEQEKLLADLARMVFSGEVGPAELTSGSIELRVWLRDAKAYRLALSDSRVVAILNDIEGTKTRIREEGERRHQDRLKEGQEFRARQPWWLRWLP